MTYEDLQLMFAKYGFTETPITEQGFKEISELGFTLEDTYSIGCDIACGFVDFSDAPTWVERYKS